LISRTFPFFIITTIYKRRENSGHETTGRNESDRIRWCPAVEKLRTWLTIDLKEKKKKRDNHLRAAYIRKITTKEEEEEKRDTIVAGLLRRF
jgi:hypothetical protein